MVTTDTLAPTHPGTAAQVSYPFEGRHAHTQYWCVEEQQ